MCELREALHNIFELQIKGPMKMNQEKEEYVEILRVITKC